MYSDVLGKVFSQQLRDHIPERVLPVCTMPPTDLATLVKADFEDVRKLVGPRSRRLLQARARIRALAVVESSLNGIRSQPGEAELNELLKQVRAGRQWNDLFPGVASLKIATEPTNAIGIAIRLTKKEGEDVHLVPEGTPGATIVSVKRVNELDYYSLGLRELAKGVGLSEGRALAVMKHLGLQESTEFFKVIRVGKSSFKRYSLKARRISSRGNEDA